MDEHLRMKLAEQRARNRQQEQYQRENALSGGGLPLSEEKVCTCKAQGCEGFACKGECGCPACFESYMDFLSEE